MISFLFCHFLSDSGDHARIVSSLIKRSEYSINQFLSCVDWVNVGLHNTLHMPPREKSRGIRSGDLAGHATGPPLPVDSVQMCSYLLAEVRWSAIMLEPHFSASLHEQLKRVLEKFQVSCSIQTVWNDDRSQQIISKNSTPDVYIESRLVNSDEHCEQILVVQDVAVSAVEVAISCEAGLVSK